MEHLKYLREFNNDDIKEGQFYGIPQKYRHEFTVTYNPKFIYDIAYAESMTHHVIMDIFKWTLRQVKVFRKEQWDSFLFNYVVEYQSNGYPHIHGTILTNDVIKPIALANLESLMKRKYGRTEVYATGNRDRVHKNDHFEGTWQQYLCKEGVPKAYQYGVIENAIFDEQIKGF